MVGSLDHFQLIVDDVRIASRWKKSKRPRSREAGGEESVQLRVTHKDIVRGRGQNKRVCFILLLGLQRNQRRLSADGKTYEFMCSTWMAEVDTVRHRSLWVTGRSATVTDLYWISLADTVLYWCRSKGQGTTASPGCCWCDW